MGLWSRHEQFRNAVGQSVSDACSAIGFDGGCEVHLVGFPTGRAAGAVRCEPAAAGWCPSRLRGVPDRVMRLMDADDQREPLRRAMVRSGERHRLWVDDLRRQALVEALGDGPGGHGRTLFASRSVVAAGLRSHVVVTVDATALDRIPGIPDAAGTRLTLVHALVEEILHRLWLALLRPLPGDRTMPLRTASSELARGAARRVVGQAVSGLAGWRGDSADALLSAISTLPYEGRPGRGTLLFTAQRPDAVRVLLRFATPVSLRDRRTVRKIVEATDASTGLLVDGEGRAYGIGTAATGAPRLAVSFLGRGEWELTCDDEAVLRVQDGEVRLPARPLPEERLRDQIDRLFPAADTERLLELARAAARHSHGAMLVISGDAAAEAARLAPQAIVTEPALLPGGDVLTRLTAMDGAVLVDPGGRCHAVGVVLDGTASGHGDPSRGSRFNNPVRYLDSGPPPTIIVVYSIDGGVDILPGSPPRVERRRVVDSVRRYLLLVDTRPAELGPVFDAWDALLAFRFYLSEEQCREINDGTARLAERYAGRVGVLPGMPHLVPDPAMDDTYWLAPR
jgi:hypothetical protein